MKRYISLLLALTLAPVLFGQDVPVEEGTELTTGKNATLGVEASTEFAWDIENKTTGLETKAGFQLLFPLFSNADRGLYPEDSDSPAVRLALKNAAFQWLNVFETKGGNYEQDNFNSWQARPLVLTFDTFFADVVWYNYFFRVASSTTTMQTNFASLFSIFDDVMDVSDRWYYRRSSTRALWPTERYNIQSMPLLKEKIVRDYVDDDYRNAISGILAFGAEFDLFSAALKLASNKNGKDNNDNAWLVGADFEAVPINNLKLELTTFAGFNYEKTSVGKNPVNFAVSAEYRLPLSERFLITPKLGFDFTMDTAKKNSSEWELGAGVLFHTRGELVTSSRILDWDDVIPVGASLSMNLNNDFAVNMMLSVFEPAGSDSLLPYFGGFLQFELANLTGVGSVSAFAFLTQIEYMIDGKITPYIRGGYAPEFQTGSSDQISGNYLFKAGLGCYLTPIHFFSIDVRYEMDTLLKTDGKTEIDKSVFSTVFTIRM